MPRRTLLLIGVYTLVPSLLILIAFLGWMAAVENATVILQSVDSADGRYRAQVVRQDPGVSSNYKYMVRLAPAKLNPLAEKLRSFPFTPRYTPLVVQHEPEKLDVRWTTSGELTIRCQSCTGATRGKQQWRDVHLIYQVE